MNTSNITNYKLKDFAELLGVSVKTLQRWDREGILKANRTPTDRRYKTYMNINKSAKLKKLEKKLRREQRCLSRKYENLKKGESTQSKYVPMAYSGIYHCGVYKNL